MQRVLALGLAVASSLGAQQLPFESYSTDDGLAQSAVGAIVQTPEGHLWFATQAGVSRFDGREFANLGVDDGLPGALVRSLAVAPDATLWLGTEDGAARLDPLSLRATPVPEVGPSAVRAIAVAADGTTWFGTWDRGLVALTPDGSVSRLDHESGLPDDRVRALLLDDSERLWAGSWGSGLARLDGTSWLSIRGENADQGRFVRAIEQDPSGRIWMGADDGLWQVANDRLERIRAAAPLDQTAITALLFDRSGRLWLATRDRGTCRLDAQLSQLECLGVAAGLADNSVYALLEDTEGSLWFGTYGGGVSRLSTEGFFNFRQQPGLVQTNVYAFTQDLQGRIWVGTNGGGVSVWDGATWQSYTTADGLAHDKVVALHSTADGTIWLGTLGGACSTTGDGRFHCLDPATLPDEIVLTIAEGPDGSLWLGTHQGLVRQRADGSRDVWSVADGLPDDRINVVARLHDGEMVVGTGAGLARYRPGNDDFVADSRLESVFVTSLYEDSDGRLWVATTDGLFRLDGERMTAWGAGDGLPHRLCSFVIGDGRGGLWIGTNRGIAWFDGQSFSTYNARDGLPSSETNRNAAFRDREGRLWFGTVEGIAVVRQPGNPLPRRPPRTVITAFSSRDVPLPRDGSARVPGDRRDAIDIDYVGISLSAGPEVSYEIALEGFDGAWKRTRSRSVQYTALPPGRYSFLVRSRIPGSELSEPARLDFEIIPAWWQRLSVRIAFGVLLVGLAVAWGLSLKRRNVLLERRVRERTRELERANTELEHLALHDRLTGLANRHALGLILPRELADRRRALSRDQVAAPLALALVDLDRFKPLNDAFGHAFGDQVLAEVGQALLAAVRETDVVARWGGEEFLILLRDAATEELPMLATRVLQSIRSIDLERPDGSPLEATASLGWCSFPANLALDRGRWEEILHLADLALYEAKSAGRDCARGWCWSQSADAASIDDVLASRQLPPSSLAQLVDASGVAQPAPATSRASASC